MTKKSPRLEMLLKLGPLIGGVIVNRPSKSIKSPYVADVVLNNDASKKTFLAHCPSLSLAGLVSAGEPVMLEKTEGQGKCQYRVVIALEDKGGHRVKILNSPNTVERLVGTVLKENMIASLTSSSPVNDIERQVTLGQSRIDYRLRHQDGSVTYLEVKSVPLCDLDPDHVPQARRQRTASKSGGEPLFLGTGDTALFPFGKVRLFSP